MRPGWTFKRHELSTCGGEKTDERLYTAAH